MSFSPATETEPQEDDVDVDKRRGGLDIGEFAMRSISDALEGASQEAQRKKTSPAASDSDGLSALKAGCALGKEVEVFSKSAGRWFLGTVVEVNGNWIVVEYQDRRNNIDLSSPD